MVTEIALSFLMLAQVATVPVPPRVAPVSMTPAQTPAATVISVPVKCDARPWQRLVGRTVSDLLTIRLPPGTRVYRLDDPPLTTIAPGLLSVEINRSTRIRRVYCS